MKQYFIIGIFTGNHIKIDTTVEGVEGPARQPRPKDDQGDTGPKSGKGDRGLKGDTGAQRARGDTGDQGDTCAQGPPGSGGAGSQGPERRYCNTRTKRRYRSSNSQG